MKATVNGEGALRSISIDPSVVDPDRRRDARRSRGRGGARSDAPGEGVAAEKLGAVTPDLGSLDLGALGLGDLGGLLG